MAFQQGLSGLASSSKSIDVTSNNIANANTVGFKAATAQFADVYASALSGASTGIQIGIGGSVNAVRQAFTQGNLATSNNPLDLAINGNGFFRLERNDGSVAFSRNGQFDVDREGFIVTSIGDKVTGFVANNVDGAATVFAGQPSVLQIDTANIDPKPTELVTIGANLDAREVNPLSKDPPGGAFDGIQPISVDSYNSTTSLTVFDSLGNPHSMSLYFVKVAPPAPPAAEVPSWDVWTSIDGGNATQLTDAADAPLPLRFEPNGKITDEADIKAFSEFVTQFDVGGGAEPLEFELDLSKITQFGSSFSVSRLDQDGFTTGQLTGLVTTRDGVIQGRFSNGASKDIGKIALANFQSPNGLISLGNNLWAESPDSGQPIIGSAGTGVLGVLSAGTVEESNVDLTQELVNLIIQQRNYQANAQSIRTQDQILQTLVNLR